MFRPDPHVCRVAEWRKHRSFQLPNAPSTETSGLSTSNMVSYHLPRYTFIVYIRIGLFVYDAVFISQKTQHFLVPPNLVSYFTSLPAPNFSITTSFFVSRKTLLLLPKEVSYRTNSLRRFTLHRKSLETGAQLWRCFETWRSEGKLRSRSQKRGLILGTPSSAAIRVSGND